MLAAIDEYVKKESICTAHYILELLPHIYPFLLDIQVVSEVFYYWTVLYLPSKGNYCINLVDGGVRWLPLFLRDDTYNGKLIIAFLDCKHMCSMILYTEGVCIRTEFLFFCKCLLPRTKNFQKQFQNVNIWIIQFQKISKSNFKT